MRGAVGEVQIVALVVVVVVLVVVVVVVVLLGISRAGILMICMQH